MSADQRRDRRPDESTVARALGQLRAAAGSHSPSVAQLERALPGVVQIDACYLSNPYATAEVMPRLRAVPAAQLAEMVAHYPSQASEIAAMLAPRLGLPADCLHLANGACEAIQALLADSTGPVLINVPTFSAYDEFAQGPILARQLDPRQNFRVDLDALDTIVRRQSPDTIVLINPNNPDGGLIAHADLVSFLRRVHDRVRQVIVDESFAAFTTDGVPDTVTGLVAELPRLVVVNSLSKSHGVPGLRLGYAVMSPERAKALGARSLWNLNAFAEWFSALLCDPTFQQRYELARRRYVGDTREFFAELGRLQKAKMYPSAANFALLQLDRDASEVVSALLARHGIYVRGCGDKRGLDSGHRYIRVAARSSGENRRIVDGLRDVLSE